MAAAVQAKGMQYIGFVSEQKRDEILSHSKFLLDPSWSKTYGEHFNRVVIDAMLMGVVPIARNLGVSNNEKGEGFLKPGKNYLMIPWDATPKQFGDLCNKFLAMQPFDYGKIIANNWEFVKQFDRKTIASQYLGLAFGLEGVKIGKYDHSLNDTVDSVWSGHFKFNEKLNVVSTLEDLFG
jgi:hypothetical protein